MRLSCKLLLMVMSVMLLIIGGEGVLSTQKYHKEGLSPFCEL